MKSSSLSVSLWPAFSPLFSLLFFFSCDTSQSTVDTERVRKVSTFQNFHIKGLLSCEPFFIFFSQLFLEQHWADPESHAVAAHRQKPTYIHISLYRERGRERREKKKTAGRLALSSSFFFFCSIVPLSLLRSLDRFFFFSGASTLTVCVHDCNLKARLPGKKPVERSLFCGRNARFTKKARNCKKKKRKQDNRSHYKTLLPSFIYIFIYCHPCVFRSLVFSFQCSLLSFFFFE